MGPVAGAAIELIKILLNFAIDGTITAGVGELANFLLGCSFVVPAVIIYRKMHIRKGAIIGMATGTVLMTIFGCFLNAFVLLPAYGKAFGMPMEALVGMGTAVNAHITSLFTFVAFAVAPFNILKGIIDSLIVFLIYKKSGISDAVTIPKYHNSLYRKRFERCKHSHSNLFFIHSYFIRSSW